MGRKGEKSLGEVYTNLKVVHYLLDEVNYIASENLAEIKIIEPSAGMGAFAIEIIKRLETSAKIFGFDFLKALNKNLRFVELNTESFKKLKEIIEKNIINLGYNANKINREIFLNVDYLATDFTQKFDCIVGNPPYVRHENIVSLSKENYKKKFRTFKFRADIYILFYEHSLNLLSDNGRLSFICSNRWLYNQYGILLRKKIAEDFHLQKLINIEKTTPFDEKVIAYPCISTILKKKNQWTYYFETTKKKVDFEKINFNKILPPNNEYWSNLFLKYNINHPALSGILEQGFKIGIGVATGADKIFIKNEKEINGIEKSRLIPIIKSKALKGDKINWGKNYVINPFEAETLCNLNDYPHLKKYFNDNKTVLMNRYIAKKTPKNWYKTIDKIKIDLIKMPKILLPDLSGSKFLFIDEGNFYPHHNVYYITTENIEKLKVLACILMSDFIKNQIAQIGIKMNGGLPRFQAQTLKKVRIPKIANIENQTYRKLIAAYNNQNLEVINNTVNDYCFQNNISCQIKSTSPQK